MSERSFVTNDGTSRLLIDGDTVTDTTGKRKRIDGMDALEIDKIVLDDEGNPTFKRGHVGATEQANAIARVIEEGGFNIEESTGQVDQSKGKRELVNYKNADGEDLVNTLYASGVLKLDENASPEAVRMKREADLNAALFGENSNPYSDIAKEHNNFMNAQGLQFKTRAINEALFNSEIHSEVDFRKDDRGLDNRAEGLLGGVGPGWRLGVEGLKEGFFGYADAIGETFGLESVERFGEAGVARSRERIKNLPDITIDYKDINSISRGFEYMVNNMAMMAPQMLTVFGSMAVAAPVAAVAGPVAAGAVAMSPISIVSAGQTWNEMEGEKGAPQLVAASMAGVGVAALERFGLSRIIKPGKVLSPEGEAKIVSALMDKEKLTRTEATAKFNRVVGQEVSKFSKSLGERLDPEMIRRFSLAEVAKRGAQGFGIESGTEILQDSTMMLAATIASETGYSQEEVIDRLINAGLAGGMVGAPLSSASSIYNQGKNKLLKTKLEIADPSRYSLIENKRVEDSRDPNNPIMTVDEVIADFDDKPDFNSSSDKNIGLATRHHDSYKKNRKGVLKMFKEAEDPADYITASVIGLRRLVAAMEYEALPLAKLLQSKVALASFHTWGAETTGRYHTGGGNHKEYQDLVESELGRYLNKQSIAKLFGVKAIRFKNAETISKQIIDFGKSGQFKKWDTYILGQQGAYQLALTALNPNANIRDKEAALKRLEQLGLSEDYQIRSYMDNVKQLGSKDGLIELTNSEGKPLTGTEEDAQRILYSASLQFRNSSDAAFRLANDTHLAETGEALSDYNSDSWWQDQGFDWKKVKRNKDKFLNWLKNNTALDEDERMALYESIVREGQGNVVAVESLVQGKTYRPFSFYNKMAGYSTKDGFEDFASNNLFQANTRQVKEVAKYDAVTKYFGHGGRKLNNIAHRLKKEGVLNDAEIDQYMYYTISSINSSHGTFNRIQDKGWAAVNSFLTSWSLMAGLPLAAISSIPETPMVYFNIKDDTEFKAATKQLTNQLAQAFDTAIKAEVEKTEAMLERINQSADSSSVVDRLATGERDIAFLRLHESFFRGTGIIKITQIQRRINAGFGLDFIKNSMDILDLAPRLTTEKTIKNAAGIKTKIVEDKGFDFEKMNDYERRAYNQLTDLGVDIDRLQFMMEDLNELARDELFNTTDNAPLDMTDTDFIRSPSARQTVLRELAKKEKLNLPISKRGSQEREQYDRSILEEARKLQDEVNDMLDLALYRFVKERVQLPGASNRPLWMQDPRYQLFTQFNGFISTFTANIIPKLYNRQIRKGTVAVKYDTFALIVTMIALGAASQYLKDLFKFGRSSPYLDTSGYIQRAVYSSGVLGQGERVVDMIAPLYPDRTEGPLDWMFSTALGEAGPSARNVLRVGEAIGDVLEGEFGRATNKALSVTPGIGPFTGLRRAGSDIVEGQNPLPDLEIPDAEDLRDFLLK